MKHKQYWMPAPILLRLATLIALTIAFLASGCEVHKRNSQLKNDTASVKRNSLDIDHATQAGNTSKEEKQSLQEHEWFKLTLQYLADQPRTDTTINHFITQPTTVVYERGRSKHQEDIVRADSSWEYHRVKRLETALDSMNRKWNVFQKTKQSKTKGLGSGITIIAALVLLSIYFLRRSRPHPSINSG
jgi:hypothetical protein